MDVVGHETEVTSKSSWLLFKKKNLTPREYRGVEEEICRCQESVLAMQGECGAPPSQD